jgi:hypothetical protein
VLGEASRRTRPTPPADGASLGQGHHLAGLANQRDLTVRFMEFFDHYLKGAKAPAWLTEGVPYLKKDAKPEPPKEPAK